MQSLRSCDLAQVVGFFRFNLSVRGYHASELSDRRHWGRVLPIECWLRSLMVRLAIIFAASLWTWPAAAQAVVDGDTIKLKGVTWHLWGIDAPENKQSCGTYSAGAQATGTLANLMRYKTITCEGRGTDRDGRMSGLCRADGDDLSAAMVRQAWRGPTCSPAATTSSLKRRRRPSTWASMRTIACRRGSGAIRLTRASRSRA